MEMKSFRKSIMFLIIIRLDYVNNSMKTCTVPMEYVVNSYTQKKTIRKNKISIIRKNSNKI